MTLSSALLSSVKGLQSAQDSIGIISNNVANANTDGYIRKEAVQAAIVTAGVGQGASVSAVTTAVDENLLASIYEQNAAVGSTSTLKSYYETISSYFGNPTAGDTLNDYIDEFFSGIQSLSDNPDLSSAKENAVTQAENLAEKMSTMARNLEKLRLKADKEVQTTVTQINSYIDQLHETNANIINFPEGSEGRANLQQKRVQVIDKLSELVDISVITNSRGQVSILEKGTGETLLDDNRTHLSYTPASTEEIFINGSNLTALTASLTNDLGEPIGESVDLVPTGASEDLETDISGGKLRALLDIRDVEVPKVLEQLDVLAEKLTDAVNAIHNDGASFPPPNTLTGTTEVDVSTAIGFSGSVRLAVVSSDGSPASSPYANETYYKPLTLDLSTLDSGSGAGKVTPQTIIDEINEYYGAPQNRATVGNIANINIASRTETIADGDQVTFDFELNSTAADGSTFEVLGVDVNNGADGLVGSLPSAYSLDAGDRVRTGSSNAVTIDLNNGTGGPYTVTASVRVTDESGAISEADITFEIDADSTEDLNDRFYAQSVTQTSTTGSASFEAAPSAAALATATYVDALGNEVSPGEPGFLKITSPNPDFAIVVDELDSQEVGLPTTATSDITYRGFSHYFGLNNFFVDNDGTENSALNFAVRSDISSNASKIAVGDLTLSNQPADPTQALYTYELGSGNNNTALRILDVDQERYGFQNAGSLASTTTTISGYASELTAFSSTNAATSATNAETETLGAEGLYALFQDQVGVDIDQELADIIAIENNYRASAQIISTVKNLYDMLARIF